MLVDRERVTAEKQGIQAQLAEINARMAVRLPNDTFRKLTLQRKDLTSRLAQCEVDLASLKTKLRVAETQKAVAKRQAFDATCVRQLVDLRDQWHEFSMDSHQPQKARETAWKFVQELRAVLKSYFAE